MLVFLVLILGNGLNTITNTNTNFTSTSYFNSSSQKKSTNINPKDSTKSKIEQNEIYTIAKKYNVKNMKIDEVISMSKELYNTGEISLSESYVLAYRANDSDKGSTYLSKKDSLNNYNMIEEFKARVELSKKLSQDYNIKNNSDILNLLIKIDGLKNGPIDIMV